MTARRLVPVLLAGGLTIVGAGPSRADSRYSLRGHGEAIPTANAEVRAQGGAEAAGSEPSLSGNPASLALALRTRFTGTYETQWVRTEESVEAGLRVRKSYSGLVPNLTLITPTLGGLRFGTGLLVDRRRSGRIELDARTPDGQAYRQIYEASGNHLRIPVLAAGTWRGVRIGGGLDVALVNRKVRWENDFSDQVETQGFRDSDDLDRISLWGVTWRGGVRVPVGDRTALGAWLSWPSDLDGSRRFENDDTDDSDDLKVDRGGELAPRWGIGIDVRPWPRFDLRADLVREEWEGVDPLNTFDELVDVTRVAFGVEWNPSERRRGLQWPLRAGYRTEQLHALDAGGNTVREHVFTAGSGFGFAGGSGTFDWYVEYGWRGDQDTTEYYEQFTRFGMTLTGVERWSRRRSPEDEDDGDW
jgi:hypothetical protein